MSNEQEKTDVEPGIVVTLRPQVIPGDGYGNLQVRLPAYRFPVGTDVDALQHAGFVKIGGSYFATSEVVSIIREDQVEEIVPRMKEPEPEPEKNNIEIRVADLVESDGKGAVPTTTSLYDRAARETGYPF